MLARDFSKLFRIRLASGRVFDDALRDVRAAGASIVESIVAVKHVRGCDLVEAKRLVHQSEAWADVAKSTEAMWAQLAEEFEKAAGPSAPPNGGPAQPFGNSNVSGGPPSVS
jgi:hypothetical protein